MPVCYRHPDRETYIRCTRCERPICPDCMTSASVGFQCPECVAEGRASVRPVRSRLGARVPTRPYVTFALIGICVAAFGWELARGIDTVANDWALSPVDVAVSNQYYRLVTSMFLHQSLIHIGFNMLVLWLLGPQLESVLGHVRFAVLYLVAGLGGSVASLIFSQPYVQVSPGQYAATSSLGASGAIFGLMGAYLVVGRALRMDVSQVFGLIVLNLVLGFVIPNTDWRAHVGGLVVGALVGAVFAYAPVRHRVLIQAAGVVLVLAGLTVLVVWRDDALTRQLVSDGFDLTQVGS